MRGEPALREGGKGLLLTGICYPTLGEEYDCFFNIRFGHVTCFSQRYMSGTAVCYHQAAVLRASVGFTMFSRA